MYWEMSKYAICPTRGYTPAAMSTVVIELYNWYSRYEHGRAAIIPTGLVLSLLVVLILLFTGWKGWEMVYRHRVGVSDQVP